MSNYLLAVEQAERLVRSMHLESVFVVNRPFHGDRYMVVNAPLSTDVTMCRVYDCGCVHAWQSADADDMPCSEHRLTGRA